MAANTSPNSPTIRRGTTAKNAAYLGRLGELTLDTEKQIIIAHDGVTAGGYPIYRYGRNYLINGDFERWTRATSQTSSGYGSDDRWFNGSSGSTKTHSRRTFPFGQTDVPGNPRYFSRTSVTAGSGINDVVYKMQKIESVYSLAGKRCMVSFPAKADAAKRLNIHFNQNFGTGGTPTAPVLGVGTINVDLTTAWKMFKIPFTVPPLPPNMVLGTDLNDHLALVFGFDGGSYYNTNFASLGHQSGDFDIGPVQVEEGDVVTEFDKKHPQLEALLCGRYLRYIGNIFMNVRQNSTTALNRLGNYVMDPPMRKIPTYTVTSETGLATVDYSVTAARFTPYGTASAATDLTSVSVIYLDAEL